MKNILLGMTALLMSVTSVFAGDQMKYNPLLRGLDIYQVGNYVYEMNISTSIRFSGDGGIFWADGSKSTCPVSVGGNPSWANIQNRPAGLDDGDDVGDGVSDHAALTSTGTITHAQIESSLSGKLSLTGGTMTGGLYWSQAINTPFLRFAAQDAETPTMAYTKIGDYVSAISLEEDYIKFQRYYIGGNGSKVLTTLWTLDAGGNWTSDDKSNLMTISSMTASGTVTAQSFHGDGSALTGTIDAECRASTPSATSISNWNTAYGWGDHSIEGYLKSVTLEAIQSACSNDFHNIGGTDAVGSGEGGGDMYVAQHGVAIAASTTTLNAVKISKSGDVMAGPLQVTSMTVTGNAFSVGGTTFTVVNGRVGIGTAPHVHRNLWSYAIRDVSQAPQVFANYCQTETTATATVTDVQTNAIVGKNTLTTSYPITRYTRTPALAGVFGQVDVGAPGATADVIAGVTGKMSDNYDCSIATQAAFYAAVPYTVSGSSNGLYAGFYIENDASATGIAANMYGIYNDSLNPNYFSGRIYADSGVHTSSITFSDGTVMVSTAHAHGDYATTANLLTVQQSTITIGSAETQAASGTHTHTGVYAPTTHNHAGTDINSGTVGINYLPTGTGATNVALGNHAHSGVYQPVGDYALNRDTGVVDWSKITNIPEGFLDGVDNTASGSALDHSELASTGTLTHAQLESSLTGKLSLTGGTLTGTVTAKSVNVSSVTFTDGTELTTARVNTSIYSVFGDTFTVLSAGISTVYPGISTEKVIEIWELYADVSCTATVVVSTSSYADFGTWSAAQTVTITGATKSTVNSTKTFPAGTLFKYEVTANDNAHQVSLRGKGYK